MRITELTISHVLIPLRKTIRHASYTREENDTLVVCCRLDDGTRGWGEGLPRPYVTGETIETAWDQLQHTNWKSELAGKISDVPAAVELCSRFRLAGAQAGERDCFGNAARCAVELSVLDACCRVQGLPLSAVTVAVPETLAIRQSQPRVRYSGALTPSSRFRDVVTAWKLRLNRFHQVKTKVGVPGFDDRETVSRLRRILGRQVDIRLDANEAWDCGTLEARLAPLIPFGISAIEQPVPHRDVDGLTAIRERLSVPVMLDESLCSLGDGRKAIERGTCDLFNIRLSKCGGMINSLKLAAMAHGAGLGFQLGCQVGETGILSAAGRHFASSVAGLRYLEGSFDRYLVRERLIVEDITFGFGGFAPALGGGGLGVTIDRGALARVTLREEHFNLA